MDYANPRPIDVVNRYKERLQPNNDIKKVIFSGDVKKKNFQLQCQQQKILTALASTKKFLMASASIL